MLGNLLYMYCYTSMLLTPLFFTLVYTNPGETMGYIYYFACFVVSSCNFALAMLTFFRDPKIATEVIGMLCSIALFAAYSVNLQNPNCKWVLMHSLGLPLHAAATAQLFSGSHK